MNPATALSRVLVDEMVRCGVRDVVLAPGSRSAPLALELAAEDRLRLHVRIDERSAGFLAVGLALGSGRPAAVITTSGGAVANLHPAVVEAHQAHVPLLVLTADRPPELRGTGANQTIDQIGIFGGAARFVELGVPEERVGAVAYWRSVVARAAATAGPVHLNITLREPLVPDGDESWCEPLAGRPGGLPWTTVVRSPTVPRRRADLPGRGAVVLGHGTTKRQVTAALALAEQCGWPVLSEPSGNGRHGPNAIAGYPLLLADSDFRAAHQAQLAVVVGRPGLSRGLLAFVREAARVIVVDEHDDWADPTRSAAEVVDAVPFGEVSTRDSAWLAAWRGADAAARAAIDSTLAEAGVSEPAVARDLLRLVPAGSTLLLGASRPVRDVEAYAAAREDVQVLGNRGASGIDGVVSTAVGVALAQDGPTYALVGDLTFAHDANGLVIGPGEPRPDLTIVVVDNDGGGIFSTLEQAREPGFERVFGTPHGVRVAERCRAVGVDCVELTDLAGLGSALAPGGLRVVHVRTDRAVTAALHRAVQAAVSERR